MQTKDAETITEFVILDSGSVVQIKRESGSSTQATRGVSLRLTERDYEIFRFLCDQKFASLEALYYRFFDSRKDISQPPPRECFVARQRLALLKRASLIQTQRVYSEAKSLYLLSSLGYRALQGKFPTAAYAPPMKEVDFRNYEHDTRVNLVRVALERERKAFDWIPERRIRMQGYQPAEEYKGGVLPEWVIPDAIFHNSRGERVALELEASSRKRSRIEERVTNYWNVMDPYGSPPKGIIQKVLFVACSDVITRDIRAVIGKRPGFLIERYEHFLNRFYVAPAKAAATAPSPRSESGASGVGQPRGAQP